MDGVDVGAAPGQQPRVLDALHRAADPAIGAARRLLPAAFGDARRDVGHFAISFARSVAGTDVGVVRAAGVLAAAWRLAASSLALAMGWLPGQRQKLPPIESRPSAVRGAGYGAWILVALFSGGRRGAGGARRPGGRAGRRGGGAARPRRVKARTRSRR